MALPQATAASDWDALLGDSAEMRAGVRTLCQRHGLGGVPTKRYATGSLPVYALGTTHVLKLYPPPGAAHAAVEARVLAFIGAGLPIPTPQLLASGTLDGWHYLLMSQLSGRLLADAWPAIDRAGQLGLADVLGRAIAALHARDCAPLRDLPGPRWRRFIAGQRRTAVERQRRRGLAGPWLEQIEPFLQRWAAPVGGERVLLHTEVMREHLLVEPEGRGWRLSGLFDFEPAMVGERDYEFASIGLFVGCGDAEVLRRVVRAYGWGPAQSGPSQSCRLMAQALLHRYGNLPWYLQRLPAPGAATLEQLAQCWWPLE